MPSGSIIQYNYTEKRWAILRDLQEKAARLMKPFSDKHIQCLVYGSVSRGDVSPGSDVDVFIPRPPSPALVQAVIESADINIFGRNIVQATPSYAPKAYYVVDEKQSISIPLTDLRTNEREFYSFAGSSDYSQIRSGARVPGVNKDLNLIEPTTKGHRESPVQGKEGMVAKILGVSPRIVHERVRTLERRRKTGHTGVYLKRSLAYDEDVSTVFRELSLDRPALRRRIR